ncbi:MAG: hypothetical protein H7Y30_14710 [Pyrinomonadaceae bacterium]|nr:hypothetical protein [Pyrinomonadaceae bacterium]
MIIALTRTVFFCLSLACIIAASVTFSVKAQRTRQDGAARESGQDAGRVRPPETVTCDRNNLTSYPGKVISYTRRAGRVTLRIRTDWDTTETVSLRHSRKSSPARWFLLRGAAFTNSDWDKIESSKGRLIQGMRASAWVCSDGRAPIIDWQPPTGDETAPRGTP